MSSNDLNDWTESLDFESLADDQEADGAAPEAEYMEPVEEPEAAAAETVAETDQEPPRKTVQPSQRERVSGNGIGMLFTAAALAVGTGLVGGLVMSLGIDSASLWHPEGLTRFDRILDFAAYPLNMFYLVTLAAIVFLASAGAVLARSVRRVDARATHEAEILDKVTALRIDEEHGWQDEALREHPTVAAFVTENIGAWRFQEARQRRYADLENELQRLSSAAATDDRDGLAGRYENPKVSTLADEIVRYFDERKTARKQAAALDAADRESSEQLMKLVSAARGWTAAAMDRVGVQGAAAERAAESLQALAETAGATGGEDPVSRTGAAVAALRTSLAADIAAPGPASAANPDFDDLVDRGNKLAFQIAMEVARLGPRGERLLPMTQALEELTTEFRQAAEHVGPASKDSEIIARLDGRLEQVQNVISEAGARFRDWNRTVHSVTPAVADVAAKLYGLAKGFDGQAERLNQLGERCGSLTGLPFDVSVVPSVDPVEMPEVEIGLTRFDPFAGDDAPAPAGASLDDLPFDEPAAETDPLSGLDFARMAEEPRDPAATQTADLSFPGGGELSLPGSADPSFPEPDEPVYDVDSLGGLTLDGPAAEDAPTPKQDAEPAAEFGDEAVAAVVDLAVFGAVRLDEDAPGTVPDAEDAGGEKIHDLSEFGAVPLD